MRIIHNDDVPETKEKIPWNLVCGERNIILEELLKERNIPARGQIRITADIGFQWHKALCLHGKNLKQKRFLDLGCGSMHTTKDSKLTNYGRYEPWFSRVLHRAKIDVTGVDIGNLSQEEFSNLRKNLLESNALDELPSNYYDHIHAYLLFNSPELEKQTTGKDLQDASIETGKKLRDILMPQIKRLLKPEGFFLYLGPKEIFENYERV